MVHDDDAVFGKTHIEFQPVGSESERRVERGDGVFRRESAPAAVAKAEVEIDLVPMSEVQLVPGVQLAGPYPADLQSYLVFMACVSSASKNADAARSLIKFLTAPAAAPVFKAKDMEPG